MGFRSEYAGENALQHRPQHDSGACGALRRVDDETVGISRCSGDLGITVDSRHDSLLSGFDPLGHSGSTGLPDIAGHR